MKSIVKRKKSNKNVKNLFLILLLLFFIAMILYLSNIDIFSRLPFFTNKQDSDVLAASQVSLTRISRYDIEFNDLDGQLKSIRPKGCVGFDIQGSPGVASSMQTSCLRNYNLEYPNPPYYTKTGLKVWSLVYPDQFGLNITTPEGYGLRRMDIFPTMLNKYASNMSEKIQKYRPILQDISGIPVMFYFGGVHEINLKNKSTYLLTRMYDSGYYTRAFQHGNIPNLVYKIAGNNNFIVYTPNFHSVNEQACFVCSTKQNSTLWGCKELGGSTQYCPAIATDLTVWVNGSMVSTGGKYSPELLNPNHVTNANYPSWVNDYGAKLFRGNRSQYAVPGSPKFRSYNTQVVDSISVEKCASSAECSAGNPTNSGLLYVSSKNSYYMPYNAGYNIDYNVNCIGKTLDNSCQELLIYGARRDTKSNFSFTGYRHFVGNVSGQVNCSSTKSAESCYKGYELLHDNRWQPYSNVSTGYEIPFFEYVYSTNATLCSITNTNCIKATDWNDSNGKITTYNSFLTTNTTTKTFNKPSKFFPPANVDFNFTTDLTNFAIKINPPSDLVNRPSPGNYGSMDIYRYGISISDGTPYSEKFTYNFTAQSPMPKYYRADEISVTYSINENPYYPDIDIMFSSLNANPNNYSPSELRILRLKNGLSTSATEQESIIDITNLFNFTGIYPLTFKRYSEDGSFGTGYVAGSDYYVFVSQNYVYHSPVPKTDGCILNIDSLNISNINSNSFFYGLKFPSDNVSPHLVFKAGKPIYCKDPVTNLDNNQKPLNAALVTFYDPINNKALVSFPTKDIDNLSTINFDAALNNYFKFSFPSGMKLDFDLNFSMGNENVLINSETFSKTIFPNILPKGFTVYKESGVSLDLKVGNVSYDFTQDLGMTVQKNSFVSQTYNLKNFGAKTLPILINSSNSDFINLFFDHDLYFNNVTSRLEDAIAYKICFTVNVVSVTSSNSNLLAVAKNPSNSKCVDAKYLHSNVQSYNISTQTININLEQKVGIDIGNVEFNGNVYAGSSLIQSGNMFKTASKKFEGSYITSTNNTSTLKYFNNSKLTFSYFDNISSLKNFSNFNGGNFSKFNFLYANIGNQVESDPLVNSSYITLDPALNSTANSFEIIDISKGRGVLIDLTNTNITKSFDKYVLMNIDSTNSSRIKFKVDCANINYSLICSGNVFNFKGAVLGGIYIEGEVPQSLQTSKFIRIHENASILVNLIKELRSNKYPTVTSTLVNLKYE